MNKNMRIWIIGICVALVVIIVAAAAAMNRGNGSQGQTGTTSESGVTWDANAASTSGTTDTAKSVSPNNAMSDRHMDHSSHGGQAAGGQTAGGNDNLSRYLTEQDSIMMNMMEDMMIREKSGSADIDFLKGMIPHHESAIKMSESYLNYGGEVSDLQTLAQDIITAQKQELTLMNDLIKKYEKEGKKDQAKEDAYLAKYSEMFSDDSMSHHINPEGVDNIDQAFAEGMIMHHQMAVDMAKDILDYSDHDEVKKLAQDIIDLQEKEIEQMQKLIRK